MVTLTKEQIRNLYGVKEGDVVAFGARIKHAVPKNARRVKVEFDDFGRKILKALPSKPAAPVIESEVIEI